MKVEVLPSEEAASRFRKRFETDQLDLASDWEMMFEEEQKRYIEVLIRASIFIEYHQNT